MTPERRREIIGLLFISVIEEEGVDLRKFRRDVGTDAEKYGVDPKAFRELMNVAAAHALRAVTGNTDVDPWVVTNLPKDEVYAVAEKAVDNALASGKLKFVSELERALQPQCAPDVDVRNHRMASFFWRAHKLGISTNELLELFEDNYRKYSELVIAKVKETVAVVVGQTSKA